MSNLYQWGICREVNNTFSFPSNAYLFSWSNSQTLCILVDLKLRVCKLLPTFSPIKKYEYYKLYLYLPDIHGDGKIVKRCQNIFSSNIVAKSCNYLAKFLKLQEAAGCRLNKTIAGICFSISYPLLSCASRRQDALLCTSCLLKQFYWVQTKYTAFLAQKHVFLRQFVNRILFDWKWDFNCHEAIKNLFNLVMDILWFLWNSIFHGS